jgi:creatinine amidohydrolase
MNSLAHELPWTELAALAKSGAVALLPVGSTEAHGPHLPLGVDVYIAQAVCRRVTERLEAKGRRCITFPAVPYGVTDFAAAFAGTISLTAATASALLEEVLRGIAAHGFRRIVVVNHHLEPAHFQVVHQAAKAAADKSGAFIAVPDHRKKPTGPLLGREFTHGGSHAGQYETSLMLVAAPEKVQPTHRQLPALEVDLPSRIKAGAKTFAECGGDSAYLGTPASASAEEGGRLLEILAEATEAALQLD